MIEVAVPTEGSRKFASTKVTHHRRGVGARQGFTLVETIVVMGIIALLLAILLPGLQKARGSVRALQCASNLKSVVTAFDLFARGESEGGRGDSHRLGKTRFFMNDFQESQYGLDEFWDGGPAASQTLRPGESPMLCPAVPGTLTKRRGLPCGREAVKPIEAVGIAANMRLYRATMQFKGRSVLAPAAATYVSTSILQHPYVPLAFDVSGSRAATRGVEPFYSAPPAQETADAYADGRFWIPGRRHGGKVNVGFVGGHVLSSRLPEEEFWDWSYQGTVGR